MDNTIEKLIELLRAVQYQGNAVHGYHDNYIQNSELADHLIANGVTMQSGIDAKTFQLMRECERLKEENQKLSNAVNVLYDLYSQRGSDYG